MLEIDDYRIADLDAFATPVLLVFEEHVDHNIERAVKLAGGAQNLFTHAKTHKSESITRKQIDAGIDSFKVATLRELEMVLRAGARRAILAYPLAQASKVESLLSLVERYPDRWIATIAGSGSHVELLGSVVGRRGKCLRVMLDLDPGMHRTGIAIGDEAAGLYRQIHATPSLEAAGLHWYDGQDTFRDPGLRAAAAQRNIDSLRAFRRSLEGAGMPVPCVVGGGGYSFMYYARTEGMHGSPGSFIYWDALCQADLSDMGFRNAALVLTQVVDRHPGRGTVTTDLGSKAICTDQRMEERVRLVGCEAAELILHNEEYGVFRIQGELPAIGTCLLAIPGHIGPTVACYPGSHVIDSAGKVVAYYRHTARDRE
jgi:D-serine deaminase-like pyridoxal phosphate-dependent protein